MKPKGKLDHEYNNFNLYLILTLKNKGGYFEITIKI